MCESFRSGIQYCWAGFNLITQVCEIYYTNMQKYVYSAIRKIPNNKLITQEIMIHLSSVYFLLNKVWIHSKERIIFSFLSEKLRIHGEKDLISFDWLFFQLKSIVLRTVFFVELEWRKFYSISKCFHFFAIKHLEINFWLTQISFSANFSEFFESHINFRWLKKWISIVCSRFYWHFCPCSPH